MSVTLILTQIRGQIFPWLHNKIKGRVLIALRIIRRNFLSKRPQDDWLGCFV